MPALTPHRPRADLPDDPPEGAPPDEGGGDDAGAAPPGTQTLTEEQTGTDTTTSLGLPWNVIVWDDPVNLMSYVVYVLQTLFGYPREKATRLMLEVHNQGRSLVASADRENAEYYVTRLHGYGLQATLERSEAS
jgi:ATP-dependent Clp protease adaptor protein ClpS